MKRQAYLCSVYLVALALLFYLSACSKSGNSAPTIMFNSTPASPYADTVLVYRNTTLAQGTHFYVSLAVSKSGESETLNNAIFSKSVNGKPDSVFQQFTLTGAYFYGQYFFTAGDSGNTEKYIFTFSQTNGLMTSDSIVIKDSI